MTTQKKSSIKCEVILVAFMMLVGIYIVIDGYGSYQQSDINKNFLKLHQLETEITENQVTINENTQAQIDMIVKILYEMNNSG